MTSTPPPWSYAPTPVEPPKKKHTKRNWALAIGVPVLLIGLGAGAATTAGGSTHIGSSAAATTVPAATTIPAATTTVPLSPDNAYLDEVYRLVPAFAGDREDNFGGTTSLLFLGNNACQSFAAGYSVPSVDDSMVQVSNVTGFAYSVDELGVMVGSAVAHLCPAYGPELQAYDTSQGY